MIKIYKTDTIIDIVQKIQKSNKKKIVLDIAFWHHILHSKIWLKVIKNNAKWKKLIILTSNITVKKILNDLNIKTEIVNDSNNLIKHNYSFFEYMIYLIKNYFFRLAKFLWIKKIKNINIKYKENSIILYSLLTTFIFIVFLIFIYYFAINKAYINITPNIVIKTKAHNFVFKENISNRIDTQNLIKLTPINHKINIIKQFEASWINEKNIELANWKVVFYNYFFTNIELLPDTRLQTENWILLLTKTSTKIPKAIKTKSWIIQPWKRIVDIKSSVYDINGDFQWKKANIKKYTKLIIPWLKNNNGKLKVKTFNNITWASDNMVKHITKHDIKSAKENLILELKQKAIDSLINKVNESNTKDHTNYKILDVDDIFKYSKEQIFIEKNIINWKVVKEFDISGSIVINSYIYNKNNIISKLSKIINDNILFDIEKLHQINNQSVKISHIINRKNNNGIEIKATATIDAFYTHNFRWKQYEYINYLKNEIFWLDLEKSKNILLNDEKISNVNITIRPFFITEIPKIKDNIIIKIKELSTF